MLAQYGTRIRTFLCPTYSTSKLVFNRIFPRSHNHVPDAAKAPRQQRVREDHVSHSPLLNTCQAFFCFFSSALQQIVEMLEVWHHLSALVAAHDLIAVYFIDCLTSAVLQFSCFTVASTSARFELAKPKTEVNSHGTTENHGEIEEAHSPQSSVGAVFLLPSQSRTDTSEQTFLAGGVFLQFSPSDLNRHNKHTNITLSSSLHTCSQRFMHSPRALVVLCSFGETGAPPEFGTSH